MRNNTKKKLERVDSTYDFIKTIDGFFLTSVFHHHPGYCDHFGFEFSAYKY